MKSLEELLSGLWIWMISLDSSVDRATTPSFVTYALVWI